MTSKLIAMYLGELMAGAFMVIVFYFVSLLFIKRKNKPYNIIAGVIIAFLFFGLFNKNLSLTIGIGIILTGSILYLKVRNKEQTVK